MIKCYAYENDAGGGDNYICVCDVPCCRYRVTQTGTRVRCYDIYGEDFGRSSRYNRKNAEDAAADYVGDEEDDDDDDCRWHGITERSSNCEAGRGGLCRQARATERNIPTGRR